MVKIFGKRCEETEKCGIIRCKKAVQEGLQNGQDGKNRIAEGEHHSGNNTTVCYAFAEYLSFSATNICFIKSLASLEILSHIPLFISYLKDFI